jgi:hypothetical protein
LLNTLSHQQHFDPASGDNFSLNYVDFILTTANAWKTPIEDFTLIIEHRNPPNLSTPYVSFCWSGPVEKLDANRFSAHIANLVPTNELRVGYIWKAPTR